MTKMNKLPIALSAKSSLALLGLTLGLQAQAEVKTGYFIDAPVTGLFYSTSSNLSGTTEKGAFQFRDGDIVNFYLGSSEQSYLLSKLSAQMIVTPTAVTTKPSRSINITRLLLALDSTPENREEIILLSDLISQPEFQRQLQKLDLNSLDEAAIRELDLDLPSIQEAAEHLNQSQQYISQKFNSDEIVFSPLNKTFRYIVVKKRDYSGRICALDLKLRKHPDYQPPIGTQSYKILQDSLIEYPESGDYFDGCYLEPSTATQPIVTPKSEIDLTYGLYNCAVSGCTRQQLNGFAIDDYNDDGDQKYRSIAINFDPSTELVMEKLQGLGPKGNIRHANRSEDLWFTFPVEKSSSFNYEGVWQQTSYLTDKIEKSCLLIKQGTIHSASLNNEQCPLEIDNYDTDVTHLYPDMWWVDSDSNNASLEQFNITVTWRQPQTHTPNYTTWEYLPVGKHWDKGILYRYQQTLSKSARGMEQLDTYAISEYQKITGVN